MAFHEAWFGERECHHREIEPHASDGDSAIFSGLSMRGSAPASLRQDAHVRVDPMLRIARLCETPHAPGGDGVMPRALAP